IGVTLPYLLAHQNKVDVGKWDLDNTIARMWAGLLSGYHLVLGGTPTGGFHLVPGDVPTGAGIFDNTIAGFWLAVLAFGTILPAVRRFRPLIERGEPQTMVATALAWLTCLVMLVLRVVYFFTVDATSVSPHYFAVDYFFVILLIALAFNSLYTLAYDPSVTGPVKPLLRGGAALVMVMTVVSAIGQTATYYRDPYFDTYMSKTCNWSQLTNRISAVVANDDTILAYDFLFASTLTYVRPLPNQVISLIDLKEGMFGPGAQVAYLSMNLPPVMLETATADLGKLGLHPLRTVELSSPDWQGCTVMWQHVELRYFRKD
ncbi:MAG TPA: hypothetical protein VK558_07680, partial [Patescibacteria group bacterium]|nr:hypothetical protein [Patescibacteria group bacterium]